MDTLTTPYVYYLLLSAFFLSSTSPSLSHGGTFSVDVCAGSSVIFPWKLPKNLTPVGLVVLLSRSGETIKSVYAKVSGYPIVARNNTRGIHAHHSGLVMESLREEDSGVYSLKSSCKSKYEDAHILVRPVGDCQSSYAFHRANLIAVMAIGTTLNVKNSRINLDKPENLTLLSSIKEPSVQCLVHGSFNGDRFFHGRECRAKFQFRENGRYRVTMELLHFTGQRRTIVVRINLREEWSSTGGNIPRDPATYVAFPVSNKSMRLKNSRLVLLRPRGTVQIYQTSSNASVRSIIVEENDNLMNWFPGYSDTRPTLIHSLEPKVKHKQTFYICYNNHAYDTCSRGFQVVLQPKVSRHASRKTSKRKKANLPKPTGVPPVKQEADMRIKQSVSTMNISDISTMCILLSIVIVGC